MTNKTYIEAITFEEIIKQALEQKEEIAESFLETIKRYGLDYSYFTLIVDFKEYEDNKYYLIFIVDTEYVNGYSNGFNLKLMTFCQDDYTENELTKDLIIGLLEKRLDKLKQMTSLNK